MSPCAHVPVNGQFIKNCGSIQQQQAYLANNGLVIRHKYLTY